ncbi:MAG: histidine kinase [Rhodobacteraceae bacterium]|nr:histidine kinase [Paracoccaceae bacterium]
MTGKILALILVLAAAIAGGSLYYLQVYAYYDEVTEEQAGGVTLVANAIGKPVKIVYNDFQAIDSDSSPLRFRACFSVKNSVGMLTENFRVYDNPVPNMAPGWFDCFDAKALGAALEEGTAVAFLGEENVRYGFDRVVAVLPDGRGFAWHQINHCGEVVFDGNPAPEGCPPVPEGLQ